MATTTKTPAPPAPPADKQKIVKYVLIAVFVGLVLWFAWKSFK